MFVERGILSDSFTRKSLQGEFICSVVKHIFDESGFFTSYFGYESLLPVMKNYIQKKETDTAMKIRSTPDLIALNIKSESLLLIEVKSKNYVPDNGKIPLNQGEIKKILNTIKFWSECFIIYVVPDNQIFYAQQAKNLEFYKNDTYLDLYNQFQKLEKEIYEIKKDTVEHYRPLIKKCFPIFLK